MPLHLDDDQLLAIIDGREPLEAHAEHLDACASCRAVLALARQAAPEVSLEPVLIGRYELLGLLGEGGMGVVYRAWDPEIRREVALKVWASADSNARERLQHEAQVMGRLSHPGLATVYDAGYDERFGAFLAVELIAGETLRAWSRGPHTVRERVRVLVAIAEAVAAAHDAGVVHGDLKPENVLMRSSGTPVVADFGLAQLDGVGVSGGTHGYAAPEQVRAGASVQADQYALSVVARELGLPRRLDGVWARGTRSDPDERWPDMHALIRAVGRRQRGWAWLLVPALAVAAAALIWRPVAAPDCAVDPGATQARLQTVRANGMLSDKADVALSSYVRRWANASEEACTQERAPPCLISMRAELEALLQRLESSESTDVVSWVAQLPSPDGCESAAYVPAPELAEARALRLGGDPRASARAAGRIALMTENAGLAAEAELLRGKALIGVDVAAAQDSLWRATVSASTVDRPHVQAEAMLALALVEARHAGRIEQAERLVEQASGLAQRHELSLDPAIAFLRGMLADARGNGQAALEALSVADALAQTQLPPAHPFRLQYAYEHAVALARLGRHRASADKLEQIAAQCREVLGAEHPRTALVDGELGSQLANIGRWTEAEPRLRAAVSTMKRTLGDTSPVVLDAEHSLAVVVHELGRTAEARELFLELHQRNDRADRSRRAFDALCAAGDAELETDGLSAARARYDEALRFGTDRKVAQPAIGYCLARRGSVERQLEAPTARDTLRRAVDLLEHPAADPLDASFASFELAQCTSDPAEAKRLAEGALAKLTPEGAVAGRRREMIRRWLEKAG